MALEDDLRAIQTRISTAQGTRAKAQVQSDNATAKIATARATLKEEFKVETGAAAKELLGKLETALTKAVADVDAALTEAGA